MGSKLVKRQLTVVLLILTVFGGPIQAAELVMDFEGVSIPECNPCEVYGFSFQNGFFGGVTPAGFAAPAGSDGEALFGIANTSTGRHFLMTQLNGWDFGLQSLDVWFWDDNQGMFSTDTWILRGYDMQGSPLGEVTVQRPSNNGQWVSVALDPVWHSGVSMIEFFGQQEAYSLYSYMDNLVVNVPVVIDFEDINQTSPSKAFDVPQGFTINADEQGGYFGSLVLASAPDNDLAIFGGYAIAHIDRSDERVFDLLQLDMFLSLQVSHPGMTETETLFQAYDKDGNLLAEKAFNIADNLGWTTVQFDADWTNIDTLTIRGQDQFELREIRIDNIRVEIGPVQVQMDVRPYSANNIDPASVNPVPVGIISTSTASGEVVDFDATEVDGATLRFGIGQAPIAVTPWPTPWATDLDGDSDNDLLVAFNSQEAAILCEDTKLTVTGETFAGDDFTATDTIVTPDCPTASCHP
jgi:hypothetical protein